MDYRPPQIMDEHLRRAAAVYIRQSSAAQVRDNIGSAMMQRDLVKVPLEFGWAQDGIELRDDLGSSADEPGSREEFDRLLRDMAVGRLGAVVVIEFSRLGRNELDQATFAHTARLYNVLLIVQRTIYDFRDPNSAYVANLMGFGAVREHRIRIGQGREARRRKAEHGLEPTAPPIGFVRTPAGLYAKTDDDRIRGVIQFVWDTFFRLRSGRAVVRHLRQQRIQLPHRTFRNVGWRDATWTTVISLLKTPAYGGIYIYGQTRVVEAVDATGRARKRQVSVPRSEWIVKEGLHTGYVTPTQYHEAQRILASNRVARRHPPGQGNALLQGVLRCAVHHKGFFTIYDRRELEHDGRVVRPARYICDPGIGATGSYQHCCSFSARRLDPLIEGVLFERLTPATLDEIDEAFQEDLRQHKALVRAREDDFRRVDRTASELEHDYLATPAEQRHVKDRLRTLWEEARARVDDLKTAAVLDPVRPPERLTEPELAELRQLLDDLPRLWRHPSVTPPQRKTILRLLVKDVVLQAREHEFEITVHWVAGGSERLTALNAAGAKARATEWHRQGRTSTEISAALTSARAASVPGKKGYTIRATRSLLWRIRNEHRFTEEAFRFIHRESIEGQPYAEIKRGLIAAGIPHSSGRWTTQYVRNAVARMRRASVFGLPMLPMPISLRDEVRRLAEAGDNCEQILAHLLKVGRLTVHRRQPTLKTIQTLYHSWKRKKPPR